MKLKPVTTLEQFRDEMQHRVVKYPLNSRPVKEALRFAKKHEDPAFYRIASDKIHAQRQFQRELYGPGRLERLGDFVSLGSLREVIATLVLVAIGVAGLDGVRRWTRPEPSESATANLDLDTLAKRLGIALETNRLQVVSNQSDRLEVEGHDSNTTPHSDNSGNGKPSEADAESAGAGSVMGRLTDDDVARIADAITARLNRPKVPEIDLPDAAQSISVELSESDKSAALADTLPERQVATNTAHPSGDPIDASDLTADSSVPLDNDLDGAGKRAADGQLAASRNLGAVE